MKPRRALITGGAGFIGSHVADRLLADGAQVVVLDDLSSGTLAHLAAHLDPAPDPRLSVVHGDVRDLCTVKAAMAGCDTVFHLQANADVRGGQDRTRIDLEQNTLTTWNVLEAMRGVGANTIIFSSSATVYGEPSVFPTPEDHPLVQTSLYGASKLSGEAMIQAYAEYFGMRGVIFRFVSCVGPRYGHGVIVDFLRKLRADPTRLDILGDGTQRKSYLDVRDAITGLFLALQTDAGPKAIFNLGHDDFLTVMQVARIVLDELRLPAARIQCGTTTRGWLGDSPFVHLDTSRIKSLGWRAKFSIEQSLRDTVQDLLKRHE